MLEQEDRAFQTEAIPSLSQEEVAEQLALLKTHRRTLAHYLGQLATLGSAYVPPGVIHGIYEARENIQRIKETLHTYGEVVVDLPDDEPHIFIPYPYNPNFVNRAVEFVALQAHLEKRSSGRFIILSGMGGIGKTQLAAQYCHQRRSTFPNGIFWIDASGPLLPGFAVIGEALGYATAETPRPQAALAAWNYLETYTNALVVFDNLEHIDILDEPIVANTPPANLRCHVLCTTRRRRLNHRRFEVLNLGALQKRHALQLLLRLPDDQLVPISELEAAEAICTVLDGWPLALEVAAGYLESTDGDVTLGGYHQRLVENGLLAVDSTGAVDAPRRLPTGHTLVMATLEPQWEALSEVEVQVLCAAAAIPPAEALTTARINLLSVLSDVAPPGLPSPLRTVLRRLHDRALLEILEGGQIRLHTIIRAFAKQRTAPQIYRAFDDNIVSALRDSVRRYENAPIAAGLLLAAGWQSRSRDVRATVVTTLRDLMLDDTMPNMQRRAAAMLLTHLRWLDHALSVSAGDMVRYLELIVRHVDTDDEREYLVQQIDSLLSSALFPRQQAQLRVFRAGLMAQLGDLGLAFQEYRIADRLIHSLTNVQDSTHEDLKLKARIELGIGNIIEIRADMLTAPEDQDRRQAELQQAVGHYRSAADSAHAYGRDVILEVAIGIEIIHICDLLQRWREAEEHFAKTFETLLLGRGSIDEAVYLAYWIQLKAVVDQAHFNKAKFLSSQKYFSQALAEYMEAYRQVVGEIDTLERGFQELGDPVLMPDLALAYINSGDYLLAISECPGYAIVEPKTQACRNWVIALNIARRFGCSDEEKQSKQRLAEHCPDSAAIDLGDTRWGN
jgi:hypothetical protein